MNHHIPEIINAKLRNGSDQLDGEANLHNEEEFYVGAADRLEITPLELDPILYRYTDEVIAKIE